MLIRERTSGTPQPLAAALATETSGLDRRTFLRRSGIAAGALAARRRAAARQRAQGRGRTAAGDAAPRSRCARTSARTARSAAP